MFRQPEVLLMDGEESSDGGRPLREYASCEDSPNHQTKQDHQTETKLNSMAHRINTESIIDEPDTIANRIAGRRDQQPIDFIGDEVVEISDGEGAGVLI